MIKLSSYRIFFYSTSTLSTPSLLATGRHSVCLSIIAIE